MVCCILLFFFVLIYLWPRFKSLKAKKFKSRFEPVYEMLNLRHGKATMVWPLVFMLRRAFFVTAACFLIGYTSIQIYLIILPTLLSLSIVAGIKPLENASANRIEIINSCVIMILGYCLMSFTPAMLDADARYIMGYVMVVITIINLVFNIVIVSIEPFRRCYLKSR